jgi:hypothetical protein
MTKENDDENWVTVQIPATATRRLAPHARKRDVTIECLVALIVHTVASNDLVQAVLDD